METTNISSINVLTAKDISERLRIGRDKAYSLMKNPSFPSIQIGNRYLVTEQALSGWLAANQYKQVIV